MRRRSHCLAARQRREREHGRVVGVSAPLTHEPLTIVASSGAVLGLFIFYAEFLCIWRHTSTFFIIFLTFDCIENSFGIFF